MEKSHIIKISSYLDKLAFKLKNKADLFIVGGYIRNSLLNIYNTDVDLCSKLTIDELKEFLEGTNFVVEEKNSFLGTAIISCDSEYYEYSTFRTEKYENGGNHSPTEVNFVNDVYKDATRRDFTANCIYYNITKKCFVDPYGGIDDVKKGILRTIETPQFVFSCDGERILRLIRIACELNFKIEKQTYKTAKKMCYHLKDISALRKQLCLVSILNCSTKYSKSKPNAHIRALKYFNDMQLWTFLGSTKSKIKYDQIKKAKANKLVALLIDITNTVKPENVETYLKYLLGENLNFSNKQIEDLSNIICGYYDAINKMNNKDFFFKYCENYPKISVFLAKKSKILYLKYNFYYKYLKNNNIAIQIKDLKVNGKDIKKNYPKIKEVYYGKILNHLLELVFEGKIKNIKDDLLKEIKVYDYRNN